MLDIQLIREKKETVKKALLKRLDQSDFDLDKIIKLDDQRRDLIVKSEELKAQRNQASKVKPDPATIKKLQKLGEDIKKYDNELKGVEERLKTALSDLPNLPADDVLAGGKENNKVIRAFGDQPKFNFKPKDHVELATSLGLVDYERAV